jgi:hypothetical protein
MEPRLRRRLAATITTWPFILSLLVLLFNDAWLKWSWPGTVSGKLSDFAGIAVVTLLLLAMAPRRSGLIAVSIVVIFSWWKSAFSQPAIDFVNDYLPKPVGRTVDYTDLVAFLAIPACVLVARQGARFALPGATLRRLAVAPLAALTLVGVMATSILGLRSNDQARLPADATDFDRSQVARIIEEVATKHRFKCTECQNPQEGGRYQRDDVLLSYVFYGGKTLSLVIDGAPGRGFGIAAQLQEELKARLKAARMDLEYVEDSQPYR